LLLKEEQILIEKIEKLENDKFLFVKELKLI